MQFKSLDAQPFLAYPSGSDILKVAGVLKK